MNCRVKRNCTWEATPKEGTQKARLVHEFGHYGWSEDTARQAVERLTWLTGTRNGGSGAYGGKRTRRAA